MGGGAGLAGACLVVGRDGSGEVRGCCAARTGGSRPQALRVPFRRPRAATYSLRAWPAPFAVPIPIGCYEACARLFLRFSLDILRTMKCRCRSPVECLNVEQQWLPVQLREHWARGWDRRESWRTPAERGLTRQAPVRKLVTASGVARPCSCRHGVCANAGPLRRTPVYTIHRVLGFLWAAGLFVGGLLLIPMEAAGEWLFGPDEPWQRGPRRVRRVAVVALGVVLMAVTVAVMSK